MFYVYILQSLKDQKFYIGFTADLKKRLQEHKNGESKATRPRLPIRLVFYESYLNKYDALRRENYFKTSKGKITLRRMLKEFLKSNDLRM